MSEFVVGDYLYIVVNTAYELREYQEIEAYCKKNLIACVRSNVPDPRFTLVNDLHSAALNFLWDYHSKKYNDGLVVLIDSDAMPTQAIEFSSLIKGYWAAGSKTRTAHLRFLGSQLAVFAWESLPDISSMNWDFGYIGGVSGDTGIQFHNYLRDHPSVIPMVRDIKYSGNITSKNESIQCLPISIRYLYDDSYQMQMFEGGILHYAAVSGYLRESVAFHEKKLEFFRFYIDSAIAGKLERTQVFEARDEFSTPTVRKDWDFSIAYKKLTAL